MEMKGLSSYSGGNETISDKRQQVPVTASVSTSPIVNSAPVRTGDPISKNTDTTHFKPQPNAQQSQLAPSLPPLLPPVNVLQFLGDGFERLIGLAASFFKGNQRDTVDEEFEERWEQNEIAHPDLFAQQAKVQNTKQSNLGSGNQ
jgi:hypothetical protein